MIKVLVIDDEKNILNSVSMYLEGHGYSVETSDNGLDGIKMAKDNQPSIILLDLVLPDIDGYMVCKTLNEAINIKKIPIIIMSAKCQKEDIEKATDMGASDYIIKPFEPLKLLDIIKKHVQEV